MKTFKQAFCLVYLILSNLQKYRYICGKYLTFRTKCKKKTGKTESIGWTICAG